MNNYGKRKITYDHNRRFRPSRWYPAFQRKRTDVMMILVHFIFGFWTGLALFTKFLSTLITIISCQTCYKVLTLNMAMCFFMTISLDTVFSIICQFMSTRLSADLYFDISINYYFKCLLWPIFSCMSLFNVPHASTQ